MFKKFLQYFEKQQWMYHIPNVDKNIAFFGIGTHNGKFHCVLDVVASEKKLVFFSICPINVSEKVRPLMAEIITRLNYILFFGNFEMDFDDGEIRFKTSIVYEDCELTEKVIDHIIKDNITTMDSHFELLNSFITEKINKQEAIDEIEEIKNSRKQFGETQD